jgi:hypothetical protein
MKKGRVVAGVALVLLLGAACGKENAPDEVLTVDTGASPAPGAAATNAPDASAAPGATDAAPGATTKPAATAAGTRATAGPVTTAPPGERQPPKDGRYTYANSGKRTDPSNPAAGQQPFEGERYDDISHSGDTYTIESTNTEEAGRIVTKLRWAASRVELLQITIETQIGTYSCRFDPVLVITKFPVKPETYPTQTFKGEGNACNGKLDITVVKKETQKDATGKSWEAWQAKVRTETKPPNLSIVTNETQWVAPDLGVSVRSEGASNGEYKSGATTFKFSSTSTAVLKKYP